MYIYIYIYVYIYICVMIYVINCNYIYRVYTHDIATLRHWPSRRAAAFLPLGGGDLLIPATLMLSRLVFGLFGVHQRHLGCYWLASGDNDGELQWKWTMIYISISYIYI